MGPGSRFLWILKCLHWLQSPFLLLAPGNCGCSVSIAFLLVEILYKCNHSACDLVCLTSFNMMVLKFTYTVACIRRAFLRVCVHMCMHTCLCAHVHVCTCVSGNVCEHVYAFKWKSEDNFEYHSLGAIPREVSRRPGTSPCRLGYLACKLLGVCLSLSPTLPLLGYRWMPLYLPWCMVWRDLNSRLWSKHFTNWAVSQPSDAVVIPSYWELRVTDPFTNLGASDSCHLRGTVENELPCINLGECFRSFAEIHREGIG